MSDLLPKTKEDLKLSKRHLKERVKFNEGHAKDHLKAAKKARKLLSGRGKNISR
jgi:hypothetical protein